MSGLEIFLMVSGFTFIIVSFFLVGHEQKQEKRDVSLNTDDLIPKEEMDLAIQKIKQMLEDISSNCIIDADDKFSSITNEKIMAIHDFSEQLFVKLETNHQEVVFLYNMLQEKETDMKSTLNRMEVLRKENQEFIEKVVKLRSEADAAVSVKTVEPKLPNEPIPEKAGRKRVMKEDNTPVSEPLPEVKPRNSASVVKKQGIQQKQIIPDEIPEFIFQEDSSSGSKNDKILRLHKQKKSIREISKLLGLGQGEVKLVIDLYGR